MIESIIRHDTIKQKISVSQDTIRQLPDSSLHKNDGQPDSSLLPRVVHLHPVVKSLQNDTALFCKRNSIADVTFRDSANLITRIDKNHLQDFPFIFTGISRKIAEEKNADLVRHLRNGDELPSGFFHNDWGLPVILLAVLIYGIIKT